MIQGYHLVPSSRPFQGRRHHRTCRRCFRWPVTFTRRRHGGKWQKWAPGTARSFRRCASLDRTAASRIAPLSIPAPGRWRGPLVAAHAASIARWRRPAWMRWRILGRQRLPRSRKVARLQLPHRRKLDRPRIIRTGPPAGSDALLAQTAPALRILRRSSSMPVADARAPFRVALDVSNRPAASPSRSRHERPACLGRSDHAGGKKGGRRPRVILDLRYRMVQKTPKRKRPC
jgi:hypothetical protein